MRIAAESANPKITVRATVDMSSVIFVYLRMKLPANRDVKIKKNKQAVKVRERSEFIFIYIHSTFFFSKLARIATAFFLETPSTLGTSSL